MTRIKTVDGKVVDREGDGEYVAAGGSTQALYVNGARIELADKKKKPAAKVSPPDDDDNEQGDETIDAAEPVTDEDQTYDELDDSGDEAYAEEDDDDGEPEGLPNPVEANKKGRKSVAAAGKKTMTDPTEGLTLTEARAEVKRLREQVYADSVNKRLNELRRATFVLLDEDGEEPETPTRFALSRSFRQEYKRFMLNEDAGMGLSEGQRAAVDALLKAALSTAAIVPLGAPSRGEWAPSPEEVGGRTVKASDAKNGSHQIQRLEQEEERIVLSEYKTPLADLRRAAQRGDQAAKDKLLAAVKKAADRIDYKGL